MASFRLSKNSSIIIDSSVPLYAIATRPVSSYTMIVTESVNSEIPRAAL